uniref:Uncharacterized protein n=1 Tax=Meloidogyne enterolobii TaxID=390850 RepID=A0A6V7VYE4_MELEN|nr:unnamed protein product [Meloidogyne enterolobii]
MKEDISSDSDYELIQSKGDLKQENEMENKNVFEKQENQINVEELKQTFQQMIDEIKIENSKQNSVLKGIIEQKDEKIIYLENKVKQMEESTNKNFGELTEELERINNLDKQLSFVQIANKWKEIEGKCCEANCITTEKPIGNCIKGSGFVSLINDENIEYIEYVKKDDSYVTNMLTSINAENSFNKPKDCLDYSIFYFEIKYKIKEEKNIDNLRSLVFGLKNSKNNFVKLDITSKTISFNVQNKDALDCRVCLKTIWNSNDIVGCGLVYPPSSIDDRPYIFFTHNGKKLAKQ